MQTLALVPEDSNYRFITTLEQLPFVIDVRWNSRDESWYMDVRRDDGTAIRTSIRLILNAVPLTGRVADADAPPGALFVMDLTRSGKEATFDDMAHRVIVIYLSAEEVAEVLEDAA